jgi:ketosteroid isomerase-like protein
MPQSNVEIVRRFVVLDLDEAMTLADPTLVWNPTEEPPCRGPDAARESIERWERDWEDYGEVPEEFVENDDDRVLVTIRFRGRGRGSGIKVYARLYEVFTLREGRIVRMDEYTDRAEALEAARLTE